MVFDLSSPRFSQKIMTTVFISLVSPWRAALPLDPGIDPKKTFKPTPKGEFLMGNLRWERSSQLHMELSLEKISSAHKNSNPAKFQFLGGFTLDTEQKLWINRENFTLHAGETPGSLISS